MARALTHFGLFEGIGGFALAARRMGWKTVGWCEWEEFPQQVLRYHFPEAEGFGDITKTDFRKYADTVDILTGGFPCQGFSVSGDQKGTEDERYLWPEMYRAVREIGPAIVVAENVSGILSTEGGVVFEQVHTDLEAEGYEVQAFILPAAGKNAPHKRDRVWFVAYSESRWQRRLQNPRSTAGPCESSKPPGSVCGILSGRTSADTAQQNGTENEISAGRQTADECTNGNRAIANANGVRQRGKGDGKREPRQFDETCKDHDWRNFPTQSPIYCGDDGLPEELDGITISKWRRETLKGYGNAIVPEIAVAIFEAVERILPA